MNARYQNESKRHRVSMWFTHNLPQDNLGGEKKKKKKAFKKIATDRQLVFLDKGLQSGYTGCRERLRYTSTRAVKANRDVSVLAFAGKGTKLVRSLSQVELRALEITAPNSDSVS